MYTSRSGWVAPLRGGLAAGALPAGSLPRSGAASMTQLLCSWA